MDENHSKTYMLKCVDESVNGCARKKSQDIRIVILSLLVYFSEYMVVCKRSSRSCDLQTGDSKQV